MLFSQNSCNTFNTCHVPTIAIATVKTSEEYMFSSVYNTEKES